MEEADWSKLYKIEAGSGKASRPQSRSLSLASYTETRTENALICPQCDRELGNVSKLEEQLSLLKADINQKIEGLH